MTEDEEIEKKKRRRYAGVTGSDELEEIKEETPKTSKKSGVGVKKRFVNYPSDMTPDPFYNQHRGNLGPSHLDPSLADYLHREFQKKKGNVGFNRENEESSQNLFNKEMTENSKYKKPEKRIFVVEEVRNILHNSLKNQRGLIQSLTDNIPALSHFFYRGDTLSKSDFIELKKLIRQNLGNRFLINLFGKDDIPHKIYLALGDRSRGFYEYQKLEKTLDLSEFVCIILGDGHLNENGKLFQISLSKDEPNYLKYVKKLIKKILGITDDDIEQVDDSEIGVSLRTNRIDIHYSLVELGLQVSDKVKNQVSVPTFVLKNKEFMTRGIRGLFDTDGTLYVDNKGLLCIGFKNRSKPLVVLFKKMYSEIFEENLGNIREIESKDGISWEIVTASKKKVKSFIETIKPEKFKEDFKLAWLGLRIIVLSNFAVKMNSTLREEIINRIDDWKTRNTKKIFQYSIEKTKLLKKWCEEVLSQYRVSEILGIAYNGSITFEIIKNVIYRSLVYERLIYTDKIGKKLMDLFKKLGSYERISDYIKYLGADIIPDRQTIAEHIKHYITHVDKSYFEDFEKRYKLSRITFYPDTHTIKNFPKNYRNKICEEIFSIISSNKLALADDIYLKVKQVLKKKDYILVDWLLAYEARPKYQKGMKKFLVILIYLIKRLIFMLDNDKPIVYKALSEDSNVYFGEKTVRDIIVHLEGNWFF